MVKSEIHDGNPERNDGEMIIHNNKANLISLCRSRSEEAKFIMNTNTVSPDLHIHKNKKNEISLKKWKHLPKRKKWFERRKLKLRSMGLSNKVYDQKNKKIYSIQFYDYDCDGIDRITKQKQMQQILKIFPYDLLTYQTKHGIHFISFSLLHGSKITKARAVELSKKLGNQDYWTTGKNLVLRVSEKWKGFKVKRKIMSPRPEFMGFIKRPKGFRISNNHLEFYRKFLDLPDWVYNSYNNCDKYNYKIGITHYKTRD